MKLSTLSPVAVWQHFENICAVPHPSSHEQAVAEYIKNFAIERKLEYMEQECGNIVLKIPATEGCEGRNTVILQAHTDMVAVAEPGKAFDPLKDPITPIITEDGWVRADGTSLGADDGMGVAMILALIDEPNLEHGPLTAVFTVCEETSMLGAQSLPGECLQGQYLINLDSEKDQDIFVGCAGSCYVDIALEIQKDGIMKPEDDEVLIGLKLSQLSGGHSGEDIYKKGGNAIYLMARLLQETGIKTRILDFKGGEAPNSIPASCSCSVMIRGKDEEAFHREIDRVIKDLKDEYRATDPNLDLICQKQVVSGPFKALTALSTSQILDFISGLKIGPLEFVDEARHLVKSSCNLSLVNFDAQEHDEFKLLMMPRFLEEKDCEAIIGAQLNVQNSPLRTKYFDKVSYSVSNRHGSWLSPSENALISALSEESQRVRGVPMSTSVIHGGLECGMFVKKGGPQLQLISIGANIEALHSVAERVEIKSVQTMYEILKAAIGKLD